MNEMRAPYVRTGYESVIATRSSSKFVISAKDDGIVENVTKDYVTVTYKTLGKKKYKLKSWNTKEESNTVYTHKIVSNIPKGKKFPRKLSTRINPKIPNNINPTPLKLSKIVRIL